MVAITYAYKRSICNVSGGYLLKKIRSLIGSKYNLKSIQRRVN